MSSKLLLWVLKKLLLAGEDDDDLELNYLIERHVNVAMSLAAQPSAQAPPLEPDQLFGQKKISIPNTKLSAMIADRPPPMMAGFKVKRDEELAYDHNDMPIPQMGKLGFFCGRRDKQRTLFF